VSSSRPDSRRLWYLGAGKLDEFLPDENGIFLIAFQASDDTGGAIWEITEDQFDAMEVHSGSGLFEWPTAKRVYEVKEYRPEENVAVANWRESIAGSQLAGDCLVADAIDHIEEIRTVLEPEAQKSRRLQRRIRSIIRKLDRRRMEDQQEILDQRPHRVSESQVQRYPKLWPKKSPRI